MKVKLIAVTQPLIEGIKTAEDLIVYCARVSNPNNKLNTGTGGKLLKYCIKHQHWSIFEQANMTVEIQTSRAIAAQILRHKSMSFQEFSQRYAKNDGTVEPIELRLQGETNRQVGTDILKDNYLSNKIQEHMKNSYELYEELVDKNVATECARFVLPLNTTTTMNINATVRSWIHYFNLRCAENTQKEHREVALAIREIFIEQFPIISKALEYIE